MNLIEKLLLIGLIFCLSCNLITAQSIDIQSIDNQTKTINPKETQQYYLNIKKDELAFMRFEQKDADVVIQVKNPDGKLLMQFDTGNGKQGPELVQVIPNRDGAYQIEVSAIEEQKKAGKYSFHFEKKIKKAASYAEQLHQIFEYWEEKAFIPGFATAIVTKDKVLLQEAYGYANLADQKPYTLETIQNIGSVSKTLIGISLMKAVEDGKIALDDPINQYLPYEVVNPRFPNTPITIRQLANHTSSIAEMDKYEMTYILKEAFIYQKGEISKDEYEEMRYYTKNKKRSMANFLKALLAKNGDLYSKKNYLKHEPGSKYAYSNAGATLAAHIIEIVYDLSYAEFTKQHILEPLGMSGTGWSYETIDASKHTNLHFINKKVIPKYTLITYPDGGLLTNVVDLSKYLQNQMKGYYGEGTLISSPSYQEMMKPSLSEAQQTRKSRNYGIFWEFTGDHIGHNGGDPGAIAFIRFDPESGVGRVMMMNIIPNHPNALEQFKAIWGLMGDFGEVIKKQAEE
ncbi:MAG: serine hydrolase domain-containing protein [Bacteroidota bacterium]